MNKLENKVAVVTGSSQGIGRCIAEVFAKQGAKVIGIDVKEAQYEADNIKGYVADITDREGLQNVFAQIIEENGNIDVLVNNAGLTRDALLHKMTEEMWDCVINVNLKGMFNVTQIVGPHMVENGSGSIINISSIVGEFGNVGQTNYAATKAGVVGMTKTWASELARKGAAVRVNSIAPGFINTEMTKLIPEKLVNSMKGKIMLGRLGEPEEIAKVATFLAGDDSSYVTSQNISVNGGVKL